MKAQWFSDPRRREFAKLLQAADYHRHSWDLFSTFLDMASLALRQGVNRAMLGFDEKIEYEWEKAKASVKYPDKIAHAMGEMVMALEEKQYDFLGTVMSEWGVNDAKWKGQVFTPPELSRAMVNMTLQDVQPDPGHRLTLNEPACGGGSMLIVASEFLKERGFFPWNYWWVAQDIDLRCVQMTYIQATFLGIPAVVVHGNTLAVEVRSAWPTLTAALYPLRREQRETEATVLPAEPARDVPAGAARQLSLF